MKTSRFLGQNFLINKKILKDIADAVKIESDDIILEIGAGTGNLTKELAQKAEKVIAIEKDKNLIKTLKENLKDYQNIEILNEDILKLKIENLKLNKEYKVVGNIPYYLTSYLLRIVFEKWSRPKLIVLTIQKEVAQRILTKPPNMNVLALMTQYFSEPKLIQYIDKENFRPVPKVDSAIISLAPNQNQPNAELFNFIKAGFKSRRQTLINNLNRYLKIEKIKLENILKSQNINVSARAESLSFQQWTNLSKFLAEI